jgi:hypothetical protein
MQIELRLEPNEDGSMTLVSRGYELFTFHTDGSVFAHGSVDPWVTGLDVTKKMRRVKLTKE